jgi:transposase-like protein
MTNKKKQSTEAAVREIRRRTRRKFAPEEKVRIVLEGLRGEQTVASHAPFVLSGAVLRPGGWAGA